MTEHRIQRITVEQVAAGDTISLNADGSNHFTVTSIRDGMVKGLGFRTTDGEYLKLPWGMTVYVLEANYCPSCGQVIGGQS